MPAKLPAKSSAKTAARTPAAELPRRRPQMVDIARLAGVSVSTVSRALNGSTLIPDETRERIAELAKSMNYAINAGAKNLRTGVNRTIAVVVPYEAASRQNVSDPFFLSILGSIADALTDRGYDMLLSRVEAGQLTQAAQLVDAGRAVGIILIGQWRHHDQLNEMAARRLPIAVWGAQLPQQAYCTVGGDNVAGGDLATDHLLQQGRRRIAFFGDPQLPEVAMRMRGYRKALRRHGVAFNRALCVPASFAGDGGRRAVLALRERGEPFDAIFACSDVLAMTAIGCLREHGVAVPDEVSVVGYDDIGLAANFHPALTTVHQPVDLGGHELVLAALDLAENRPHDSQVLPARLIVRESSVPTSTQSR